jgi:multicomponent Na+:H+ antiporter subunit D
MYSLLIAVPLLVLLACNLLPFSRLRRACLFFCALLCAAQALVMALPVYFLWSASHGPLAPYFKFGLAADALSRVVLFCIGLVGFAGAITARYTVSEEERPYFAGLFLALLAAMNAIAMARDIFSLYVFIEVSAVSSFVLISLQKGLPALEGAFKYIVLSAIASVMMLFAVAIFAPICGSTDFAAVNAALKQPPHSWLALFGTGLFLAGLFIKAGVMPFHGWLPDAYAEAPAAVSVLLAGIVTKAAGVYGLMRLLVSVLGVSPAVKEALLLAGVISVALAALAAIGQDDVKRMLAYCSISQVGYIILGIGCATPLGLAAAVFHFFNHAVFKSLLFVNAGCLEMATGERKMHRLCGLGSRMPVTAATSFFASFSAAGMPPLAGFWSKLMVVMALWSCGARAYALVAILAGVLTLGYFLILQRDLFFAEPEEALPARIGDPPAGMVLLQVLLAAIILAAGLFFPALLRGFILPAGAVLGT